MNPDALTALIQRLRMESSIDVLEQAEGELKKHLQETLSRPLEGAAIRELASLQQQIGFLPKYKSYAVKAASPLGYSVFLQRPGEGFSFQQHIEHKTELFYMLDVLPGGYVFLCDFEEWQRVYNRDDFLAWLGGRRDPRYERWKLVPEPGDVIVIDKLNVVHSVIGCTLVEFATVSTDMVDRLHDQNQGRKIPPEFSRDFTEDRLRHLSWPDVSQRVTFERGGWCRRGIPARPIKGGVRTVFDDGDVGAAWFRIDPGAGSDLNVEPERAVCLHVVEGSGRLVLGDEGEIRSVSPPTLTARAGDLFFVAPGAHYGFVNDGTTPLTVAEHKILSSTAFV